MHQRKFVAYCRVSTEKQGRSGLGLEAHQEAVRSYLNGGDWQLMAEVESGKKNDRPRLAEALRLCRLHSAVLIIAKLDRLARNVAFISNLMESGVEFTAVNFPQANRLTVHMLAAVAEHEPEMISRRIKDALAAAKAGARSSAGAAARSTSRPGRERWPVPPCVQARPRAGLLTSSLSLLTSR
jgi:DNA invertase Pin-like site-specific DNA recombinase